MMLDRRAFLASATTAFAACAMPGSLRSEAAQPRDVAPWSLYAFDNGLNGPDVPSLEQKAGALRRLGYSGMTDHFNLDRLEKVVDQLDRHGLELVSLYHTPFIEDAPEPRLASAIRFLKGRRTRIELGFRSRIYRPSDPAGDARGLYWLKHVADLCADSGPTVSIYPHKWFWTERAEDGVRLARLMGGGIVGTNFNLIHWQISPQRRPFAEVLREAAPHLSLVTVCGLSKDHAVPEVLPLNQGEFDLAGFLGTLRATGFSGPVGLQCYGIKGDSIPHLTASMGRWKELQPRA